ncbi:MAG: hypothetical protein ACKVZ0_03630 [Gemmatimonadales bacterium]
MSALTQRSTRLALLFFITSGLGAATAQSAPNLSGTWALDAAKSNFGPLPAPQNRSDVIDHREPRLTITRTILQDGTPTTLDLKYAIDGKPHSNTTPQGQITSSLTWEGQVLVMKSQVPTDGGAAVIVDRMTLSSDGRTLTQDRTISVQGQEIKQTIVLVKQ